MGIKEVFKSLFSSKDKLKEGNEFISRGTNDNGQEVFDIVITSRYDYPKHTLAKRLKNQDMIEEAYRYVGGNPKNGLLNPEYIKNAENLKMIRRNYEKWSPNKEMASDGLFNLYTERKDQVKSIVDAVMDEEKPKVSPHIIESEEGGCKVGLACLPSCKGHKNKVKE